MDTMTPRERALEKAAKWALAAYAVQSPKYEKGDSLSDAMKALRVAVEQ